MKNFKELLKPKKPKTVDKPTYSFVKKPTKVPDTHDPYAGICRIMPFYVASNYKYFELLTTPKQPVQDWEAYVLRIKKKISCLKADLAV
jgi:hypothetical protein